MAQNIIAQVVGGQKKLLDSAVDVLDVRKQLNLSANYVAAVNGDAATNETELNDKDYVSFAVAVKGA